MDSPTISRRIAHLDMDAFYASVELLRYPELKGYPVVIGGRLPSPRRDANGKKQFNRLRDYRGRGVVTTSTYEARALGVFSAMPMMRAAQKAPDAFLLPVDFPRYRAYSRRFKQAVMALVPSMENRGIDEIYLDLSFHPMASQPLAQALQRAVYHATGLTCSIGIASNKLLAKIVSEFNKPNGITLLADNEIKTRIWPLPVNKINGIGPRAQARLRGLKIDTIEQLANTSPYLLQKHFGLRMAVWLIDVAHGRDDRPVVTVSEPKSVSRETTFERDYEFTRDKYVLFRVFNRLCKQLEGDLQRRNLGGYTIGVKLRFDNFQTVTRDHTGDLLVTTAEDIYKGAKECLKRITMQHKIRLFGIRVSKLVDLGQNPKLHSKAEQLTFNYTFTD